MDDFIQEANLDANEIFTKIVGVSFQNGNGSDRQAALASLLSETLPLTLTMKPEPDNQYDPYAIAILTPSGVQLGYIRKNLSFSIAKMIEYGYHVKVELLTLTGTEDFSHHYGANIRIQFEEPSFDLDF